MWETIFFWIFAVGALLSSLAVVIIPRNPLYNALALILDFFFFAGLYGLLSAHFLAVVQVLVYGGAIMVLFMFIIMLLNIRDDEHRAIKINFHQVVGIIVACGFLGVLAASFHGLIDEKQIQQQRQDITTSQKSTDNKSSDNQQIDIPSPIPGLSVDINESAIEHRYDENLLAYASQQRRPANGPIIPNYSGNFPKYREFDPSTKINVPKQLLPNDDKNYANRKDNSFGTIQPLSILLIDRFVVPFELTAILLLAAVVGAFIIAKKRL